MLKINYVPREHMPEGHTWALVERRGVTVAYVIDSVAERVAREVYSRARSVPTSVSA